MARAKQITADKLERLGGKRLAEILEEHAGADAILRRELTLALSALDSSDKLAVTLEKRIHTIGRSRSSLDWEKGRALAKEIDHLRTTIAGPLAERNARLAAERMWHLVGIADAVLTRIHGSGQAAVDAFEAAIEDLARLWSGAAARQPKVLARRVFAALQGDRGYLVSGDTVNEPPVLPHVVMLPGKVMSPRTSSGGFGVSHSIDRGVVVAPVELWATPQARPSDPQAWCW